MKETDSMRARRTNAALYPLVFQKEIVIDARVTRVTKEMARIVRI